MQVGQPSQDALVSFSDFLLEKFGLVASMQVAVVASIAFHTVAIVGLGFNLPRMMREVAPHNMMDVVLVNSKSFTKPTRADALAQATWMAAATRQEDACVDSFPMADPRQPSPSSRRPRSAASSSRPSRAEIMLQLQAKRGGHAGAATAGGARDCRAQLEIERLEAQIRREPGYQERPRKKFIGARTEEYRYTVYIDRWRQKVERIGTLNYPAEARTKGIYASLQLTVGIKQNGEIESVEVNRSSGYKFLDRAAERIVRLASPFEPFPRDIRSEWDILYITRTYNFTRADEVVTSD
jgi:protein TonB